jgi:hypothetical protein
LDFAGELEIEVVDTTRRVSKFCSAAMMNLKKGMSDAYVVFRSLTKKILQLKRENRFQFVASR